MAAFSEIMDIEKKSKIISRDKYTDDIDIG